MTDEKVNFQMLNNNNYDAWKFKIEMFLNDKMLWYIISEKLLEVGADQDAWNKTNNFAKTKTILSAEDNQLKQPDMNIQ